MALKATQDVFGLMSCCSISTRQSRASPIGLRSQARVR
jgi:hypothetical protein